MGSFLLLVGLVGFLEFLLSLSLENALFIGASTLFKGSIFCFS